LVRVSWRARRATNSTIAGSSIVGSVLGRQAGW
jgi:hypothetical protein